MKFRVTVKDPDVLGDAIKESAEEAIDQLVLSPDEREAVLEKRIERISGWASRWVEYGEYYIVEFDTDANTARLVAKGE